jgi:hypothetical protein
MNTAFHRFNAIKEVLNSRKCPLEKEQKLKFTPVREKPFWDELAVLQSRCDII